MLVVRQRLTVKGVVQGVGFRPFVFRLAHAFGLVGFVGNDSVGVFIEVEGLGAALTAFAAALRADPPPLAVIESIHAESVPVRGDSAFVIVESVESSDQPVANAANTTSTLISPDVALCEDCLRELFEPTNRRYRYPFINCTHCGPRFTIMRGVPYDRPLTTMSAFPMCPACRAEYENPLDRRFHAQPNACSVCGPRVWLLHNGLESPGDVFENAARLLNEGAILAVKGIGGFHLVCDATNHVAVERLRVRKGRAEKPFALMLSDLDAVRAIVELGEDEAALLTSRERPILLLTKKPGTPLSAALAPGNSTLGVMLPYSPLHYCLLSAIPKPLVMTSGNFSGEPILTSNEAALRDLAPLVDGFLLHNRDIQVPCDDSVVRFFRGHELPVRRSRGYAPMPIALPDNLAHVDSVLACGGELKATFCLTRGGHAFMSQHIGDMENLETLDAFTRAVAHFEALFRVSPQVLICDSHPRYLSAQWAAREATQRAIPLLKVQHHHAHITALMAEHGLSGTATVIGICFDGTGYGTDGAIWGGEALLADYRESQRLAHLDYMPLPGGDSGVRNVGRLALAYLAESGVAWAESIPSVRATTATEQRVIRRQLETGLNIAQTSSMGRLFDAAAAIIGIRQQVNYEAQAAIELESAVDPTIESAYPLEWRDSSRLDPRPIIRALAADVQAGVSAPTMSARFHNTIADIVLHMVRVLETHSGDHNLPIALSGGVFQNTTLLGKVLRSLTAGGIDSQRILLHRRVPPNDGGLALGQAAIGCAWLKNQHVDQSGVR